MQTELKPRRAYSAGRAGSEATDERRELALLAEYMRAEFRSFTRRRHR